MTHFPKRILSIGYGAVAECTLPILFRHLDASPRNLTILDFEDRTPHLAQWSAQGATVARVRVAPDNLGALLGKYVSSGDLIVDLAWNIDAGDILQWCHDHGVLYVNTSTEVWDPYAVDESTPPTERTLYWRHLKLRERLAAWKEPGPTAVLEHGANPGLISHFTKQGLIDIANAVLADAGMRGKLDGAAQDAIRRHLARKELRPACAGAGGQGHPLQRARHPGSQRSQGGGRVRQHVEHRRLPRGRHNDGGDGLGNARKVASSAVVPA